MEEKERTIKLKERTKIIGEKSAEKSLLKTQKKIFKKRKIEKREAKQPPDPEKP